MHPSKRKGDRAERSVLGILQRLGFPWTKKTRAGYERDLGDLHLCPGPAVICAVKAVRVPQWGEWFAELDAQIEASGADTGFLAVKRHGFAEDDPRGWLAVQPLDLKAAELRRAGYGEPMVVEVPDQREAS